MLRAYRDTGRTPQLPPGYTPTQRDVPRSPTPTPPPTVGTRHSTRGVLVAALTTVLGFGTLMVARHRGMASLGLALTLGVTFSMVASLVWLPAVLRLLDERSRRATAGEPRVVKFDANKQAA